MKRFFGVFVSLFLLAAFALAAPNVVPSKVPAFPKVLNNARYVYVAAYDGDQFDPALWPNDRVAIANVQAALQSWGRYVVVYRPQDADMILLVQSRPTEDLVAVYDAHVPGSNFLWRAMGRDGLQKGETPLISELQMAVEAASK